MSRDIYDLLEVFLEIFDEVFFWFYNRVGLANVHLVNYPYIC